MASHMLSRLRRQARVDRYYVVEFIGGLRLCSHDERLLKQVVRTLPSELLRCVVAYYYTWGLVA